MKFRFLLFILFIAFTFFGISDVNAMCYKVRDAHSLQVIEYTNDTSKYQNTTKYKLEVEKDTTKCGSIKNYNKDGVVSCGDKLIEDLPSMIPRVIHIIYMIIEILVPILLTIFGTIDFLRSIIGGKDDEVKKYKTVFVKRIIISVLVFFTFAIAKIIVSFGADDDNKANILKCASCIINNDSECIGG